MSEAVIEFLKVIYVNNDNGVRSSFRNGAFNLVCGNSVEEPAIVDSGKAVGKGVLFCYLVYLADSTCKCNTLKVE